MAVVPVVDDAFGYVGAVLQFAADEARQFVEVVDDGGLLGGDDVLIGFVGAFHLVEVLHLFGRKLDGSAAEELGEACRPEVGDAFEDALVVAGDGDFVEFVQFQAFAVDYLERAVGVGGKAYAVVVEVEECGDAVAAAGGDNVDGGGGHAEDGVDFVECDGVLRHETFLAEAHLFALGHHFTGLGGTEAEHGGYGSAGQDADAFAEELEFLHGAFLDGGRDYLAQVVGFDDVHDVGTVDAAFAQEVDS